MNYAMYLILQNGTELSIPVLPDKLKVSSPGKNKNATVLGIGEVLRLREKGLRSMSWESHFPAHGAPYVSGRLTSPISLVRAIQGARDRKETVRFLLLGADLDINTTMGVESFDYEERGGEPGDLYYSIKLTEWKAHGAKRLSLQTDKGVVEAVEEPPARAGGLPTPKTYTVVSGDTMWGIAKRAYGDGAKWKDIYAANKPPVGANPNLIYAGQVLTIP